MTTTKQTKAERIAALKTLRDQALAGVPVDSDAVAKAAAPALDFDREVSEDEAEADYLADIKARKARRAAEGLAESDAAATVAARESVLAKEAADAAAVAARNAAVATLPRPTVAAAQARLQAVRVAGADVLPEREAEVDGILTAAVAKQNIIFVGPPGTGKSLTVRLVFASLFGALTGYFQWLLGRTTKDEEILGPVSFAGLKDDKYRRVTRGKLPEATAAFLDEIFKAGSSLLNNLLTILNEHLFFNDGEPVPVPLEIVAGASNEYPQDDSLNALYDRFPHRYYVKYIASPANMRKLLTRGTPKTLGAALDPRDLEVLREAAQTMAWGDREVDTLLAIKAALEADGRTISDRTWVCARDAVRARAVVNGHARVESGDWMVLADMLWNRHTERDAYAATIGNAADPHGQQSTALVDAATKAVRALPEWSLVESGATTLDDAVNATSKVLSQLKAASGNLAKVEADAAGHSGVAEARKRINAHLATARALLAKLSDYDPTR